MITLSFSGTSLTPGSAIKLFDAPMVGFKARLNLDANHSTLINQQHALTEIHSGLHNQYDYLSQDEKITALQQELAATRQNIAQANQT